MSKEANKIQTVKQWKESKCSDKEKRRSKLQLRVCAALKMA